MNKILALSFLFSVEALASEKTCEMAVSAVRSHEYPFLTSIDFVNLTTGEVNVNWIDYNGKRVFYKKLKAHESYRQLTFPSHPWVIESTSGKCLGLYYGEAQHRDVVVHDENFAGMTAQLDVAKESDGKPVPPRASID